MTLKSDSSDGCLSFLVLVRRPDSCETVFKDETEDLRPTGTAVKPSSERQKGPRFHPDTQRGSFLKEGAVITLLAVRRVGELVESPSPGARGCFCSC